MNVGMAIHGVGVVGGFGCGVSALEHALATGGTTPQVVTVEGMQGPVEMPALLADTTGLDDFVARRAARRIDHCSRMALLAGFLALRDAGIVDVVPERTALVVATGYGTTRSTFSFLDSVILDGDQCASPTHFANSVHNAPAAHIAMLMNVQGPSLTVSQFGMSVPSALLAAQRYLREGLVDTVLFGAVDEFSSVLAYSWHRFFGGTHAASSMVPLDFDRQTAIPGEGATFFVLTLQEDDEAARYGYIDAVHLSRVSAQGMELPADGVLLLAADGHRACGSNYAEHVPVSSRVAAYSPIYGSQPTGPAFDIAIAALSLRDGCVPASPNCPQMCSFPGVVRACEALSEEPICCVRIGGEKECRYGVITLRRR